MERLISRNVLGQRGSNMFYQLLPFFLAFQSPLNTTWHFGPEYTFSGHVKMVAAIDRDEGVLTGNKMIFNLKCRPKTNDTLSCLFADTKIAKITPNAFSVSAGETIGELKIMGMMRDVFEIKFNERGIAGYVIAKTEPPLIAGKLDMTRLICNQLSVGANLGDFAESSFRALENHTNGECEVDFEVSEQPDDRRSISDDADDFVLVSMKNLKRELQESRLVRIEKKRDVHDCLVCANYFYGTRYIYGVVYRDVFTKLKKSTSTILVSEKSLTTETVNEVELFDEDRKRVGDVLDHVMLRLESVLPATEELPALKDPVDMEVIANRPGSPYLD